MSVPGPALSPWLQEIVNRLPEQLQKQVATLPLHLIELAEELPAYSDRRSGAALISRKFYRVSHRTLEATALPWRRVNGRAVTPTIALLAHAHGKLDAAPAIMVGRSNRTQSVAA
jgi:hypothetical protein